ncbi:hypothetical protein SKAU_G00221310 [Synaphobranchus kaupii]|uniref:Uncharacterized protein n=1 Tax=Synaphobranchus kaupii TaxID=118154 RepID=A0A9Q1FAP8_SYNKA|nr:hypothetical protein SKAU_G00221310 [Synaphobranchus kaupii]
MVWSLRRWEGPFERTPACHFYPLVFVKPPGNEREAPPCQSHHITISPEWTGGCETAPGSQERVWEDCTLLRLGCAGSGVTVHEGDWRGTLSSSVLVRNVQGPRARPKRTSEEAEDLARRRQAARGSWPGTQVDAGGRRPRLRQRRSVTPGPDSSAPDPAEPPGDGGVGDSPFDGACPPRHHA